ncbi:MULTISPECIES: cell division protein ZipA [Marinobacter]|jgi:cell division protein ZipA|uniref:cell division protein ZipA n=2 Tax=Marinobacteraceae TaxID=2887365 RepID=UPI0011084E23|nr:MULTISPECIES: cell division protein ZipA [Marinobacter]MCK2148910.1 cell division protein ZipA [Marinobacter alexandrii]
MSLREWLIAIGTLVIIGIVIDGIRRVRRARKESLAISSGMGADELEESPLDDHFNPELPNGGARTISRDTLEERGYVKPERSGRFGSPKPKPTRPVTASASTPAKENPASEADDSSWTSGFSAREETDAPVDGGWGANDDHPADDDQRQTEPWAEKDPEHESVTGEADPAEASVPPTVTTEVEEDTARRSPVEHNHGQPLAGANRPEAREVIVINVLARAGDDFTGTALKNLFEACGLELGDMDIYHRHESTDTTSPVQFSVANAVEPGTFRPKDIPAMTTPGISFFMSMPGPSNSLQAFEFMLETAQCVVRNLGGDLKDERRSVMTPQTIEHCRQRIREFDRKQRSQPV